MKIGLVGCGFMGEAILGAALSRGIVTPADVAVAEVVAERAAAIGKQYGVRTTSEPAAVVDGADLVVFAIKPQEFAGAAKSLTGRFGAGQTVVSIMAGVTIASIRKALSHDAVVRAMPNTPGAIGEGMAIWMATHQVDAAARAQVGAIFGALGREISVDDEKYLDMATALLGSGPGLVYLLIEAFVDAGVHVGFRRELAEMLVLQTFAGSAKYAQVTGKHVAELRNQVTSPGGTTAAGLQVLENSGVRGAIIDAVEAAYERSRELGG